MRAIIYGGRLALMVLSLSLPACNDGDSDPHETGDSDTNVTGTKGDLQVNTTFAGAPVSCFVNIDGNKVGNTNEPVPNLAAGEHDLSLGSLALADLSPDGIPTHDLGGGLGKVIAPLSTATVVEGVLTPTTRTFNRYIEGRWTCVDSSAPNAPWSGDVTYEEGNKLSTGMFTDPVTVNGESLNYSDGTVTKVGGFTSPTTLHMTSTGGMAGNYDIDCHAGS